MGKTDKETPCPAHANVESVISMDDRGQMVLPKKIRDKAKIGTGDKLAVVTWEKEGEVCCISLIKVENLSNMVSGFLGPLMYESSSEK
jgi:AbrB family looped-hinge helix DNA binding protein